MRGINPFTLLSAGWSLPSLILMCGAAKSEMANPDNSGCTVNVADGYLPLEERSLPHQAGRKQDVLFKSVHFSSALAFKEKR